MNHKTSLLVLQPTPFCNIDCTYCYLPHRSVKKRLTLDLAEIIFKKVLAFPTISDSLTIVWHAGEPMVLPVSYYERMFQLIETVAPSSLNVSHSFQTNGTLITSDWCDFLKRWNVNIGVSIDGPRELHDLCRKQRNGTGSFDRAYEGLQELQRAGIPFHVISVLTPVSLSQPDQMFEFYLDNKIEYICFNVEEQEGANGTSKLLSHASADTLYRSFFQRFLYLALERQPSFLIREVEQCIAMINLHGLRVRNEQNEPFGIISVDYEGNVSTFSPELLDVSHEAYGSFRFGNLAIDCFEEIAARVFGSRLYADVQTGVQQCENTCAYFGLCGGGAPSNKIFENGTAATAETGHCRTLQRSFDVVLDVIGCLPGNIVFPESNPPHGMWPG